MARAYFMVRAEVPEAERGAFDEWYEKEHLPDALKVFNAVRAWRSWSRVNPGVHIAFYEFESMDKLTAMMESDVLRGMVAEFDKAWGTRVPRSREVLEVVGELEGA